MNIILIESDELTEGTVVLRDHRAKHIVKVLKSEVGEILRIGIVDAEMGKATVLSVVAKYPFEVRLRVELGTASLPVPPIDLLLALPRPIMLKRILSQVTALGVGTIHLVNANRVEKSFWDASILSYPECRSHLIQGLEQAVDTRLPAVKVHQQFRPFVEDILPEMNPEYCNMLVAHPKIEQQLSLCSKGCSGRILYGIGPEGGWVDFEIEKLTAAGMQPFSMGSRILKVDTAVVAVHSRISQLLESA